MSQYLQIVHMITVIIQRNIGIIKRNICYIFLESFEIYRGMSNIWACPTTGPKTLFQVIVTYIFKERRTLLLFSVKKGRIIEIRRGEILSTRKVLHDRKRRIARSVSCLVCPGGGGGGGTMTWDLTRVPFPTPSWSKPGWYPDLGPD